LKSNGVIHGKPNIVVVRQFNVTKVIVDGKVWEQISGREPKPVNPGHYDPDTEKVVKGVLKGVTNV
jgi:hypothetical protein